MKYLQGAIIPRAAEKITDLRGESTSTEPSKLTKTLASALPESVIFQQNSTEFKRSMNSYWAQQECEIVPGCVVRPRNADELSTAVKILKNEFDEQGKHYGDEKKGGLFAVRGGGHSPVPGAASTNGGVVLDLSLFREVTPSKDGTSVVIGGGCKWADVSKVLDAQGLAVVGGRNSAVGVGGLTLGGGLSFFSPRLGMVCSNIISYEVVLASGIITTASSTSNSDFWRALKGGSNNFGIVTSFTAHSFPCTKIWSGFLYLPSFQTTKVLSAFHESVNRVGAETYDKYAAGPIACFSYIQAIGLKIVSVNLCYTKVLESEKKWPAYWQTSGFSNLWRIWSTLKVQTLTSATDEMNMLNPPGRRQVFAMTTIKNNPATLAAAYAAYDEAITSLRRVKVKGLVWTLVLQPLLPDWVRKGDANPLGLHDIDEALVIVNFTVNWDEAQNDEFVKSTTRQTVEKIEAFAVANKTTHRYRYLNYCAEWQKPFEGYGKENWEFLKGVSKKYDPEGLFQNGCVGGFKLAPEDIER
ncbi:FAD-binding domain-containing protein [Stipitochalara longipes BDJ]|nr:FAD-binding domain-containing protein [Stipitochalara longipes BDJ]